MVKLNTLADVTVTTAGTRVQVTSTDTPCTTVIIQAKATNTGLVIVGDSSVSASRGIELSAGEEISIAADPSGRPGGEELNLADFWVDAATNGDKVKVAYVKRR